ncbi:hypothetical protein Sjap_007455 [Stephania japonica]|uniref:Uncharacterized protein n=1 Tax=Stephania japonica TaxID=461633 RepID=A0AAP0JNK6_9MAGN
MATQTIESHKQNAEIYHGESLCKEKSLELLQELSLPLGLLPLDEIEEVGRNRESGFVWLKQKKRKDHGFKKIGKTVSYAQEVTAFVEPRRMKRLTGVKSREFLLWVTISEICIEDPSSGSISFKTPAGLSRSFPASAFEIDGGDDDDDHQKKKKKEEVKVEENDK